MAGTCGYGEGLWGSINAGNFLTSCKVYWLASQEGLCSMEEVSKVCLCAVRIKQRTVLQIGPCACASEILCDCSEKWMTIRRDYCMEGKMSS